MAGVAALAWALAAGPLAAQAPAADSEIPIVPGAAHDASLEPAELAASPGVHSVRAFRVQASIELVYQYYTNRLPGRDGQPLDTSMVGPAPESTSPISYNVVYYTFSDQCADSLADSAKGSLPGGCRKWLRGKDKRNAIEMIRIPTSPGSWIQEARISWLARGEDGKIARYIVKIRDAGLAKNWRHYSPQVVIFVEDAS